MTQSAKEYFSEYLWKSLVSFIVSGVLWFLASGVTYDSDDISSTQSWSDTAGVLIMFGIVAGLYALYCVIRAIRIKYGKDPLS